MEQAVQTLVDAVSVGSLYALTALGIGLIFGVMRLINFAHGELITFAAYTLLALFGLPVPVMLFGAIAVAVLLALITERAAFRPLRSADPTTLFPLPVNSWQILYRSTSATGAADAVSGTLLVPRTPWPRGPRPLELPCRAARPARTSSAALFRVTWVVRNRRNGLALHGQRCGVSSLR